VFRRKRWGDARAIVEIDGKFCSNLAQAHPQAKKHQRDHDLQCGGS
jgi:hypothetical protein